MTKISFKFPRGQWVNMKRNLVFLWHNWSSGDYSPNPSSLYSCRLLLVSSQTHRGPNVTAISCLKITHFSLKNDFCGKENDFLCEKERFPVWQIPTSWMKENYFIYWVRSTSCIKEYDFLYGKEWLVLIKTITCMKRTIVCIKKRPVRIRRLPVSPHLPDDLREGERL